VVSDTRTSMAVVHHIIHSSEQHSHEAAAGPEPIARTKYRTIYYCITPRTTLFIYNVHYISSSHNRLFISVTMTQVPYLQLIYGCTHNIHTTRRASVNEWLLVRVHSAHGEGGVDRMAP
jgi:hypothetical protein